MTQRSKALAESRQDKLRKLRAQGIDPYPPRFHRTHTNREALDWYQKAEARGGEGYHSRKKLAVAGRITALRDMGKAAFLDLRDGSQRLQVHLRSDVLKKSYSLMETLDLGDFLGVEGTMFRTRRGEITLQARNIVLLAKAHRPPPEKWHGLRDVEIRYRQRYLDLIANPGRQNRIPGEKQDHLRSAQFHGRPGLHRGGDAGHGSRGRRRHGSALCHDAQRT